jgi:hypothetical protein
MQVRWCAKIHLHRKTGWQSQKYRESDKHGHDEQEDKANLNTHSPAWHGSVTPSYSGIQQAGQRERVPYTKNSADCEEGSERVAHPRRCEFDWDDVPGRDDLGKLKCSFTAPKSMPLDNAPRLERPAQFHPRRGECGKESNRCGENKEFNCYRFARQS